MRHKNGDGMRQNVYNTMYYIVLRYIFKKDGFMLWVSYGYVGVILW